LHSTCTWVTLLLTDPGLAEDRESMHEIFGTPMERKRFRAAAKTLLSRRWEELFFLVLLLLLRIQAFAFVADAQEVVSSLGPAVALFFAFKAIVVGQIAFVLFPLIVFPLIYLLVCRSWALTWRRYLDAIGLYIVFRMIVQLVGLNLLVFDFQTLGLILMTKLLFFLPYSMLVWGWIYWRLERFRGCDGSNVFTVGLRARGAKTD